MLPLVSFDFPALESMEFSRCKIINTALTNQINTSMSYTASNTLQIDIKEIDERVVLFQFAQ